MSQADLLPLFKCHYLTEICSRIQWLLLFGFVLCSQSSGNALLFLCLNYGVIIIPRKKNHCGFGSSLKHSLQAASYFLMLVQDQSQRLLMSQNSAKGLMAQDSCYLACPIIIIIILKKIVVHLMFEKYRLEKAYLWWKPVVCHEVSHSLVVAKRDQKTRCLNR